MPAGAFEEYARERMLLEEARARYKAEGDSGLANLLTLRMKAYDLCAEKPKELRPAGPPARPAHLISLEEQKRQAVLEEDWDLAERLKETLDTLEEAEAGRMRLHSERLQGLMRQRDAAKAQRQYDVVCGLQEQIAREQAQATGPQAMGEVHRLAEQIGDLQRTKRRAQEAEDFDLCLEIVAQIQDLRKELRRHLMMPTALALVPPAMDFPAMDFEDVSEDDIQDVSEAEAERYGLLEADAKTAWVNCEADEDLTEAVGQPLTGRLVSLGLGLLVLVLIALVAESMPSGGLAKPSLPSVANLLGQPPAAGGSPQPLPVAVSRTPLLASASTAPPPAAQVRAVMASAGKLPDIGVGKLPDVDVPVAAAPATVALRGASAAASAVKLPEDDEAAGQAAVSPLWQYTHTSQAEIVKSKQGATACPSKSSPIPNEADCAQAAKALGLKFAGPTKGSGSGPPGCFIRGKKVSWNASAIGVPKHDSRVLCTTDQP